MKLGQKLTAAILTIIILMGCIMALNNSVMAEEPDLTNKSDLSFKFDPEVNKTIVEEKDTVTIALKLKDINVGKEGINTFICKLKYDESFFEDVKISSKNNWSITYNNEKDNEEYGKMVAVILTSGVTDNQEIGDITFKVKSGVTTKFSEIEFTEISTNNGTEIVNEESKKIKIWIKENQNIPEETNNTITNLVENTSKGPLPQTSEEKVSYILIFAIGITFIIAVISYKRYKKNK